MSLTTNTFISTNSLNIIYIQINHIRQPSFQNNHPGKLLVASIINAIKKFLTQHYNQKNQSPHEYHKEQQSRQTSQNGALKPCIRETPFHLVGHQTPSISPTSTQHDGLLRDLKNYIQKEYQSVLDHMSLIQYQMEKTAFH